MVEDEKARPFSAFSLDATGGVQTIELKPGLLQFFSNAWHLEDLEGLADDGSNFVYAITSFSRTDEGREDKNREKLHIDSSILGDHSVSRGLSASIVAKLERATPGLEVTYRDLAATPLPHLTGPVFAATRGGHKPQDEAVAADVARGAQVLDEFLAADIVVIGLGFYNFGIPSQLKAWIDRVAVPGKTFTYTEKGPVGLAGGKRVILAIARGGYYGPASPVAQFEHAETYLRNVFRFVGVADVEVAAAEGVSVGPEARQTGISKAEASIEALPA